MPLSFHLEGPLGKAAVASHESLLANDKIAARGPHELCAEKGKFNSTLSYVKCCLERRTADTDFQLNSDDKSQY